MRTGLGLQAMLAGMPVATALYLRQVDGRVTVCVGARALFEFAEGDGGMRNLAAVTLPELGFSGKAVAEALGLSENYVSRLRCRVRREGSAALTARRGRPPALRPAQLAAARRARAAGETDRAIARRFGVHATTIARALAGDGSPVEAPAALEERPAGLGLEESTSTDGEGEPVPVETVEPVPVETAEPVPVETAEPGVAARGEGDASQDGGEAHRPNGLDGGSRPGQVLTGTVECRYGGAMLAWGWLDRVGVTSVFSSLKGAAARRYDDQVVLLATVLAFLLGAGSLEGAKHLARADLGATLGVAQAPELATWRHRLGALGERCDPLALQRAFAKAMISFDPAGDALYFVDDHFVAYTGAAPLAKGWNTRRRHAEPGRDDTMVTDARGRPVVFSSAAPSGLSANLPGVLSQLRAVLGPDARPLIGFDRGGSYPVAFRAVSAMGMDWVSYRRAPLVAATAAPRLSWTRRDGRRVTLRLADETVELKGYGPARQLTLYEAGRAVLQVLTSDRKATGAALLVWLRARWRIENFFKYSAAHHGINHLGDYRMDTGPDTRVLPNPARAVARAGVADAQGALAAAERALAQLLGSGAGPKAINAAIPAAEEHIRAAKDDLEAAKDALAPIPAKLPANQLDPGATLARSLLPRRGLQMVLRLLAANAEAWLAEALNAYLADPNEHRAITRHLMHQPATITFTQTSVTVILARPDTPRIARALQLLTDQLNNLDARLPGDGRRLTYGLAGMPPTTTQPAIAGQRLGRGSVAGIAPTTAQPILEEV